MAFADGGLRATQILQALNGPLVESAGIRETCPPVARAPPLRKWKRPHSLLSVAFIYAGDDLLSHTLSRAVQSALRGLTSVFGMGTGGTPAVRSPTNRSSGR
jgi:hypothetical protein